MFVSAGRAVVPERKGRAVPCRGTSACDEPLTQEQDEVCHAGVVTQLEQERAYLASVVGLMVEEVTHRPPERVLAALTGARPVCEGGGEPLGREPLREGFDGCVSPCPLPPQSGKVGVQFLVQCARERDRPPLRVEGLEDRTVVREAAQPGAICQEKVIESSMHRAEEVSEVPLALLIAHFAGYGVELLVHQPIVAAHRPVVINGIHARAPYPLPILR